MGPPNLLEKMSAALAAMGDPLDRGHASAQLRVALSPHLEEPELASLDNMMRRLDTLADAVVAKVRMHVPSCIVIVICHLQQLLKPVCGRHGRQTCALMLTKDSCRRRIMS